MTLSLSITVKNPNNRKVYISFIDPYQNQITTDFQCNKKYPICFIPPIIQEASNCKCDDYNQQIICTTPSETQVKIPVVIYDGLLKPLNTIYFSFNPGFMGGKDGTFDSIKISNTWPSDVKDPYYDIITKHDDDDNYCKNSQQMRVNIGMMIIFLVLISAIFMIIVGEKNKNKGLLIFGIILLSIDIIVFVRQIQIGKVF